MPEDLPVTKCINFMVGITRSKVIKILTSKCASRHNGVHFFDISTSKSGPNPNVFKILTLKCASRHNGVHFFDISTSKSGPRLKCFVHFDFEMCFAPQRRSLFRHLNFQKWSEHCSYFLYMLTSKCASRHNSLHFFISHLASWLRTRCFSEPTFRPSGASNH